MFYFMDLMHWYQELSEEKDMPIEIYRNHGWWTIMLLWGSYWESTSGRKLNDAIIRMIKKIKKLKQKEKKHAI